MLRKLFLDDRFILVLILINAAVVFISGFPAAERYYLPLSALDNTMTILFIVEMVIKLRAYRGRYFQSNWNKLDFVLVMLSIPTLVTFLVGLEFTDLSYLLVFRVLRVMKSFRFLRFIPGINNLIAGIVRALKATIIVMLGFGVYIFIVGILSFYLFKEVSPEHFQTPMTALYSTFKIFTIEGWYDIPEAVADGLAPVAAFFTYIFFIFLVMTGGIIGLSLINSIFVDAMVSDNTDELENKVERLEEKLDEVLRKLERNNPR